MIEANAIERWMEEGEEAREIRRKHADWKFIEEQPEPLRSALKCFVELGDLYLAAKIAEMGIDEFNQLRIRAKIPIVI